LEFYANEPDIWEWHITAEQAIKAIDEVLNGNDD
jgi:hypothetical protein